VLTEALTAQLTLRGQSVWSWATLTEPMLAAVIVANVLGLVLLQMAFQRGRAAVVVPLQLAITNFVAVGTGILVFAETISAARAIAIVLIVAGTAALQRGRANHPEAGTRAHEA
jgi:uncharacterized membrane protein